MKISRLKIFLYLLGIIVLFYVFALYINCTYPCMPPKYIDSYNKNSNFNSKIKLNLNNSNYTFNLNKNSEDCFYSKNSWFITIPNIDLKEIEIKDGIEEEILENYIGHFPSSSFFTGTICLAAHNAGFKNNYFEKISSLNLNDEIVYCYNGHTKKYYVSDKYEILDNDFSMLNSYTLDKLVLVTCVSGSPSLRLCIEALSKEG